MVQAAIGSLRRFLSDPNIDSAMYNWVVDQCR
jgi:hypothetical protein